MFCQKCGAILADGAVVCNICGENTASAGDNIQAPIKSPKKRNLTPIIIVAAVLAVAVIAGVIITAIASRGNSPIQDLVEAYVNGEIDGYTAEYHVVTVENGITREENYKYAYGSFDLETAMREFSMYSSASYSSYFTPKYSYYDYKDSVSLYNNHDEEPEPEEKEWLSALAEDDYKDIAVCLNRQEFSFPMLDESGFAKELKKINREISDDDFFNDLFGYELDESGYTLTYTFDFDYKEILNWYYEKASEASDAFASEEKHSLYMEYLDDEIESYEKENKISSYKYEIVVEDGYIVSQKIVYSYEYDDVDDDGNIKRIVGTKTTEIEYDDFGEAAADKDILDKFKDYRDQLGSNSRLRRDEYGTYIYNENGDLVN